MANILLCSPMLDNQSGTYIYDTFIKRGHRVAYFDWREVANKKGLDGMNNEFLRVVDHLKPHMTFIIKGLGIRADIIQKAKEIHNHAIIGWIFDVTLSGTYVKDVQPYVNVLKEMDLFYTMDEDAVPELKELGVNAKWLPQACYPPLHGEQIINNFQKRRYGADVVFMGSVGSVHPNRERFLKRIHDEGFNFKLFGEVLYPEGKDPDWVKNTHTGFYVKNEMHSNVCNSSKIIIGLDGWPHREKSYSMRLYKVLCAGGFYLTIHTKGIEKVFKPGEHLDTFKNEDEMVEKLLKYLNDDGLRKKIAKQGQKYVLENHTFDHRIKIVEEDSEEILEKKGIEVPEPLK